MHAQITQNNKFAISLQYLNKELSGKVYFLRENKHESLQQIDSMILVWMVKHFQSSENSEFAMSLQYLKKVKDEEFPKSLFQHFGHKSFLQCWYFHY